MPKAKLSDAQPIPAQQSGKAKLSDATPYFTAPPTTGSIPWMKEKAAQLYTWGANQLPTVGGVTGGLVGGAVGGAATVGAGGEVPGAIVGSGVGGGIGEAARQYLLHKSGYDQYDTPESKTLGHRTLDVAKEGIGQAAGEMSGQALGKWLRPTVERSIAKLHYAGNLKYGDPLDAKGDLEKVFNDVVKAEKTTGSGVTVRDFVDVLSKAKNENGRLVDNQMMLPINQNGHIITLGKATSDPTPIAKAISDMATADSSIIRDARVNPAGKEAAYLAHIQREATNYSKDLPTYEDLMAKRIRLNNELAPLYELATPGERRVYLLDHPDLAVKKAEADAIRNVVYPKMDTLSGKPYGTTAELQGKRGILMSLEGQVTKHLGDLKTATLKAQGANPWDKINASGYVTSSGKPGGAIHRVTSLFHTPNDLARADSQVKKAFGHGLGTNTRRVLTTPAGVEVMSMPVRELQKKINEHFDPHQKQDEDDDSLGGQSSVTPGPRELIKKAKDLNPAATGQVAYSHVAVNPTTGHKIGSRDGKTWFDVQNGSRVA